MEISKEVLESINAPKGKLREELERIQNIHVRKENRINPTLTKAEEKLLRFQPRFIDTSKTHESNYSKKSWMDFLSNEEAKKIALLDPTDPEYIRMRGTCYTRRYYSDPNNLKLQYARSSKYLQEKRSEKKEELQRSVVTLLEERKKSLEESRLKMNKECRERYHIKKLDPNFREKDRERSRKYRETYEHYTRIQHALKRHGIIPLTPKEIERKAKINDLIKKYSTASEFRKDNMKDYNWIGDHGLRDEMLGHFSDYVRRQKYKIEKEDKADREVILLRRAKRNAEKCFELKEYKRRFIASYNYMIERGIEDEIVSLFKQKADGQNDS